MILSLLKRTTYRPARMHSTPTIIHCNTAMLQNFITRDRYITAMVHRSAAKAHFKPILVQCFTTNVHCNLTMRHCNSTTDHCYPTMSHCYPGTYSRKLAMTKKHAAKSRRSLHKRKNTLQSHFAAYINEKTWSEVTSHRTLTKKHAAKSLCSLHKRKNTEQCHFAAYFDEKTRCNAPNARKQRRK